MSTNDGGPAFPDPGRAQSAKQREVLTDQGMTLRDYFAAKAMAALIAEPEWGGEGNSLAWRIGPKTGLVAHNFATAAYKMADAMLVAREAK